MVTKQLCIECGRVKVANEWGWLYCPICEKYEKKQFDEMVESTKGGYY